MIYNTILYLSIIYGSCIYRMCFCITVDDDGTPMCCLCVELDKDRQPICFTYNNQRYNVYRTSDATFVACCLGICYNMKTDLRYPCDAVFEYFVYGPFAMVFGAIEFMCTGMCLCAGITYEHCKNPCNDCWRSCSCKHLCSKCADNLQICITVPTTAPQPTVPTTVPKTAQLTDETDETDETVGTVESDGPVGTVESDETELTVPQKPYIVSNFE